jgi:hypothetical protein
MPSSRTTSAKASSKSQKSAAGKSATESQSRKLARPAYKSFRLSKRLRHPRPKLSGSFRLLSRSIATLRKRKWFFAGIVVVYLVLTIVLVKGFGVGSGIGELKDTLSDLFQGELSQITTGVSLFAVLLGNLSSTPSDQANVYQTVLLITTSLAIIWALRQSLSSENAKVKLQVRDAFYKGMYPLVPFVLVLLVIGIQLIPVAIGSFIYGAVIGGGLAVTAAEKVLWILLVAGFLLLSLYMVTSSLFALYIATLPDMRPMQALRSARDLVRHRRWTIMRKVVFLPVALLAIAAVITIPLIMVAPDLAEWVFFILSMAGLVVFHSYLYTLYRELL